MSLTGIRLLDPLEPPLGLAGRSGVARPPVRVPLLRAHGKKLESAPTTAQTILRPPRIACASTEHRMIANSPARASGKRRVCRRRRRSCGCRGARSSSTPMRRRRRRHCRIRPRLRRPLGTAGTRDDDANATQRQHRKRESRYRCIELGRETRTRWIAATKSLYSAKTRRECEKYLTK